MTTLCLEFSFVKLIDHPLKIHLENLHALAAFALNPEIAIISKRRYSVWADIQLLRESVCCFHRKIPSLTA